jgi:hypothetical protein
MNQTVRFYLTPELYSDYIYTLNHDQQRFDYDKLTGLFSVWKKYIYWVESIIYLNFK